MPGYFLPHANAVEPFLPDCVCVQSPGAPIFQLINFIFTHLFLNVLSDGNAAGCSSEVLPWQTGLKGEVSQCQRQDFNSKLRDLFLLLFIESYPRKAYIVSYRLCLFNTKDA